MLAAADTFRAAAADQLEIWANRAQVPLVRREEGADPTAVVYDAVQSAKGRGADLLIVDTAGRLHNKKNLREERRKMTRSIEREDAEAAVGSRDALNVPVLYVGVGEGIDDLQAFDASEFVDAIF